tara:strand:+ start:735 stop:1043 length:309 start_codon:yes stop_codon:yes gene_type:complete
MEITELGAGCRRLLSRGPLYVVLSLQEQLESRSSSWAAGYMTASRCCVGITELTPPVSGVFGAGLMVFTFINTCLPGKHAAASQEVLAYGKKWEYTGTWTAS